MFYVFGEDMVPGLVGPFPTVEEAKAHIEFWRQRGDAAVVTHNNARIVTPLDIQSEGTLRWAFENNLSSPEDDKNLPGNW